MSYLALARKWRPTRFQDVVGQSHVLKALENALTHNRLHHAYLFSGTRGVGKTTIGRLVAKGLNCETGITATPCGQCTTCLEIDQGRYVDLLEIDAASRTKVEDTRELLDNVQYKPARARFKVYLIDEVHMLSRHSFNALLKTLEEPPEYVKFLLATTDPQKLPITVLSRCLQLHLKPINATTITTQLERILKQEQIAYEYRALTNIADAADGSMRDALSLTDQAIALSDNNISFSTVSHMLGTLDSEHSLKLLTAVCSRQIKQVMHFIDQCADNGIDWHRLLEQMALMLHKIAMAQALPMLSELQNSEAEKIATLSKLLSPEEIQVLYQIATKGKSELSLAPNPRAGTEMILLRMLAFSPSGQTRIQPLNTMVFIDAPTSSSASSTIKTAELQKTPRDETRPDQTPSTSHAVQASTSPSETQPNEPQMTPTPSPTPHSNKGTDLEKPSTSEHCASLPTQPMSTPTATEQSLTAQPSDLSYQDALQGYYDEQQAEYDDAITAQDHAHTSVYPPHQAAQSYTQTKSSTEPPAALPTPSSASAQGKPQTNKGPAPQEQNAPTKGETLYTPPTVSLRNQLRSHRMGLRASSGGNSTKKTEATTTDAKRTSQAHASKLIAGALTSVSSASQPVAELGHHLPSALSTPPTDLVKSSQAQDQGSPTQSPVIASTMVNAPYAADQSSADASLTMHHLDKINHAVSQHSGMDVTQGKDAQPISMFSTRSATTHPAQVNDTEAEPYQWQGSELTQAQLVIPQSAAELLAEFDHDYSDDVAAAIIDECIASDPWAAKIFTLDDPKFTQQILLNCALETEHNKIKIILRPQFKELLTPNARRSIDHVLTEKFHQPAPIEVLIGTQGLTPNELKERVYQQKREQAMAEIEQDKNIQWFLTKFEAKLDKEKIQLI